MPAMTIILEWNRAEMGIGPPVVEIMGEIPIGQIFPVAARRSPASGKLVLLRLSKIC